MVFGNEKAHNIFKEKYGNYMLFKNGSGNARFSVTFIRLMTTFRHTSPPHPLSILDCPFFQPENYFSTKPQMPQEYEQLLAL
jgi:hypothetical protein